MSLPSTQSSDSFSIQLCLCKIQVLCCMRHYCWPPSWQSQGQLRARLRRVGHRWTIIMSPSEFYRPQWRPKSSGRPLRRGDSRQAQCYSIPATGLLHSENNNQQVQAPGATGTIAQCRASSPHMQACGAPAVRRSLPVTWAKTSSTYAAQLCLVAGTL